MTIEHRIETDIAVDAGAIESAFEAAFPTRLAGVSAGSAGGGHFIVVALRRAEPGDAALAAQVAEGLDPVTLTGERDAAAETVTVTVRKPRNLDEATGVRLTINGVAMLTPVALTEGAGEVTFGSDEEITVGVDADYPHETITV